VAARNFGAIRPAITLMFMMASTSSGGLRFELLVLVAISRLTEVPYLALGQLRLRRPMPDGRVVVDRAGGRRLANDQLGPEQSNERATSTRDLPALARAFVGAVGSARGAAARMSGFGSASAALSVASDAGVAKGESSAKALALAIAGWS